MSVEDLQSQLQAKEAELAQKDAELEERGELLFKTKNAIEQLQEALASSQEQEENLQREMETLEEENAERVKNVLLELEEHKGQIAQGNKQNDELQVRLSESQAALDESHRNVANRDQTIQELKQKAATLETNMTNQIREKDSDLDECLDKITELEKDKEVADKTVADLESAIKGLEEDIQAAGDHSEKRDLQMNEEIERLNAEIVRQETLKEEVMSKLKEVEKMKTDSEKTWSKRLSKSEHEWSKKMLSAVHEWSRKLEECEKDWGKRLDECESRRTRELADMERTYEERMADLQSLHAEELSEMETEHTKRLESEKQSMERSHAKEVAELNYNHTQRLDDLKMTLEKARIDAELKASNEKAMLEKSWSQKLKDSQGKWSTAKAEIETKLTKKLEDGRRRWAGEKEEMEGCWIGRFEEAKSSWEKQRDEIHKGWEQKLHAFEKETSIRQEEIKTQVEEKLLSLVEKLTDIAKREARREKRRAELVKQVEEIRESGEEEFRRRCEVEKALREAATIFKRELHEKNEELNTMHEKLIRFNDTSLSRSFPDLEEFKNITRTQSPEHQRSSLRASVQPRTLETFAREEAGEATCASTRPPSRFNDEMASTGVAEELLALKQARQEYKRATADHDNLRRKLVKALRKKIKKSGKEWAKDDCPHTSDDASSVAKLRQQCVEHNASSDRDSEDQCWVDACEETSNAESAGKPENVRSLEKWQKDVNRRLDSAIDRLNPLIRKYRSDEDASSSERSLRASRKSFVEAASGLSQF